MFVRQSEKKVSKMLVIAKKFKEILNPEHQNTVSWYPKEYLLTRAKTVLKFVKPEGRSPRINVKLWGERFALRNSRWSCCVAKVCSPSAQGCAQGLLGLKQLFYLTILYGTGMQTGHEPQQLCDAYCSTQINRLFFFKQMSLKSWTRKVFSPILHKWSKIKAMTFTNRPQQQKEKKNLFSTYLKYLNCWLKQWQWYTSRYVVFPIKFFKITTVSRMSAVSTRSWAILNNF